MKELTLAKDTPVAFKGQVYRVSYPTLLQCAPDCDWDHDHYPEPYVAVYQIISTALPLSMLTTVFGPDSRGRPFDAAKDVI